MADRLPWFPCYQSKLLGALAGMPPDSGYIYTIIILRCYEVEGTCPDSDEVLARRSGMTKARVAKAIGWLIDHGKLNRVRDGLENPYASEVLNERSQKHSKLSSAGQTGGKKRAENAAKKAPKNIDPIQVLNPSVSEDELAEEISGGKTETKQRNWSSQAKASLKPGSSILDLDLDIELDTESKNPPIPPKRGADCRDDWPDNFVDAFWDIYPPGRKQDKAKVGRKLARLRADKTVTWSALMEGLGKFIASAPRPQYTAAPIVWLNNERWNVDYSQGGLNAANRDGDSKLGFSGFAEKLRREIAEESAGQRPTPDNLRPIN